MGRFRVAAAFALVVSVGVGLAAPIAASPGLSDREAEFLQSVAAQGYTGNDGKTVEAGYGVCSLLDDGVSHEGIGRFIIDTFDDTRESNTYYASLFGSYATYSLCPRHMGEYNV